MHSEYWAELPYQPCPANKPTPAYCNKLACRMRSSCMLLPNSVEHCKLTGLHRWTAQLLGGPSGLHSCVADVTCSDPPEWTPCLLGRPAVHRIGDAHVVLQGPHVLLGQARPGHLVTHRHPEVTQVVLARKNLQVAAIRHQLLNQLVDLLGLLALAPPLREDDVAAHPPQGGAGGAVPPLAHQAHLLGVLQVVAVALGHAPVDCHLHPHNLVHKLVAPFLKLVQGPLVLCINDPDEEKAVLLKLRNGQVGDIVVAELAVTKGHATGGVCSCKLPRRVHHDHIELCMTIQLVPAVSGDISVNRYTVWRHLPFAWIQVLDLAELKIYTLNAPICILIACCRCCPLLTLRRLLAYKLFWHSVVPKVA
mmetsp:Transcript_6223/g.13605  ORF Transcript_6223/g.13605 Transcript_6223/m.13605 type:complete len:364 (+) Transcript_6223:461-1552(+)